VSAGTVYPLPTLGALWHIKSADLQAASVSESLGLQRFLVIA